MTRQVLGLLDCLLRALMFITPSPTRLTPKFFDACYSLLPLRKLDFSIADPRKSFQARSLTR